MKKCLSVIVALMLVLATLAACTPKKGGEATEAPTATGTPEVTAASEPADTPTEPTEEAIAYKPVIYLYPTQETNVTVQLEYDGILDCTYPDYGGGWSVTAYPDGRLINHADELEYSYLFWEGHSEHDYDMSRGFVVKGSDTSEFLQEKLAYLGLTPREYNEFIVYWLPQMQGNPYNLITFQGEAYTDTARLRITPEPDSLLRVFMVFRPLEEPVDLPEQAMTPFEREGFAVIEWGGSILK